MADISISLSNVHNIRNLLVEDLGQSFKVRKLGAGEELDLSDKLRKLGEIITELQGIDFSKLQAGDTPTAKELSKIKAIQKRTSILTDEINSIKRFELETYKRCFTDDNNGKNVERLLNSLSEEDRTELFKQIFDKPRIVNAPELPIETALNVSGEETS